MSGIKSLKLLYVWLTLWLSLAGSSNIKAEVKSYQGVADAIIKFVVNGTAKGEAYNRLAAFTDKFGSRIAGSKNLEDSIDYMIDQMKKDGLENVHGEKAKVPHWVRGEESATLLLPRVHNLAMLGLGSSIGTAPGGITAEALVVRSFDELHKKASMAKGKIVVYNQIFVSYGDSVIYRENGAVEASKVGGVASLIRSIAPFSINSPHTGWQDYVNGTKKIPTACITIEDAEMLNRMADRGERIVIRLKMSAQNLPPVISRNTIAEITGSKYPHQVVLVSGHLDSWDVGQGAMDDGGGAFISWQALSIIRRLGLRPKRTLRAVLWTAEEEGGIGSAAYYNQHKVSASNFDLVMESDMGTFTPLGIGFTGSEKAREIMRNVVGLLKRVNATLLGPHADGTDIYLWFRDGVPGASLSDQINKYFYFHHSNGDTMTVQDPHLMDLCTAVWAVTAFVVADLDEMLPR